MVDLTKHSLFPEVHPSKNNNVDLSKVASSVKIWWQCDKGHEWITAVHKRVNAKQGCPVCTGRVVVAGFNDLATIHPELVDEWFSDDVLPTEVRPASHRKVKWKCRAEGHIWEAVISSRTSASQKTFCPVCSGQKVLTGYNDLATKNPEIAVEWDYSLNEVSPNEIYFRSQTKRNWLCPLGHSYVATADKRVNRGHGCPVCSGHQVLPGFNDLATTHPELVEQWNGEKHLLNNLSAGSRFRGSWKCENGHEWDAFIYSRAGENKNGCSQCGYSRQEKELMEYFDTLLKVSYLKSERKILEGLELDFYFPEQKIAVEFNGLYWHSEAAGKTKSYHYDKWKVCQDKGIQLIQVWEDDYTRNPGLVKHMLAHKLGVATEPKVFARKTKVKLLTQSEASIFLDQNHIQGAVAGSIRLGLTVIDTRGGAENTEPLERLVAVMVLKKEPGSEGKTLNLLRFATSQPVVGGFTKLLKQAELIGDIEKIITFSDNTVSDGGLYESTGFVVEKTLAPDYMYLVKGERKHKFGYRLKKFREDPKLKYEDSLTERELALLNNIPRIWDAGKTKWVKEIKR